MTHKIILDTDPGIDDAMAILFAEAHPAIGHTLQKFDGRVHPHDAWAGYPAQRVGVAVRDQALLALYRETLVTWGRSR